jgi:Holliday junction resolvase RusA-like endonuclease
MIRFHVPGIPRPGGSKTAKVVYRKGGIPVLVNGRPLVTMRDDAKGNREWRACVADFARQAFAADPLAGPLRLTVVFTMPRLKGHYRTNGEVKPNAPQHHTVKPDATKLLRSTEDALTGILWRDDAQIAEQSARKVYGERPGAEIIVEELTV